MLLRDEERRVRLYAKGFNDAALRRVPRSLDQAYLIGYVDGRRSGLNAFRMLK